MVAHVNKGYPDKDTVSNLQISIHKDVILVRIQGSPPNIASCQSGLLAHLGKVMVPQGAREFESLTRCHGRLCQLGWPLSRKQQDRENG